MSDSAIVSLLIAVIVAGAALLTYAFTTTGDQILASFVGGAMVSSGLVNLFFVVREIFRHDNH